MDPAARRELEAVLEWAKGVARAAARQPERSDLVTSGWAYVGGTMTALEHVGLISRDEAREWDERFKRVLPPPAGGWVTLRG